MACERAVSSSRALRDGHTHGVTAAGVASRRRPAHGWCSGEGGAYNGSVGREHKARVS